MAIALDAILGKGARIARPGLVAIYSCRLSDEIAIAPLVKLRQCCLTGDGCKISSHRFIRDDVDLEVDVIIGHGVIFRNDVFPQPNVGEQVVDSDDAQPSRARGCRGTVIGSNAAIIVGTAPGEGAVVSAGAIVTPDIPAHGRHGDTRPNRWVHAPTQRKAVPREGTS